MSDAVFLTIYTKWSIYLFLSIYVSLRDEREEKDIKLMDLYIPWLYYSIGQYGTVVGATAGRLFISASSLLSVLISLFV